MMRPRWIALLAALALACGPADDAAGTEGRSTPERPALAATAAPTGHDDRTQRRSGPRVVFMGTSLTAGLGLSDSAARFTARLQAMADSAGLPARMVNMGVSGETSAGGLRRIGWVLRDTVDVLVLELGANDGLRGLDPAAMEANLRAIIDSTRAAWPDARVVLVGMEAPPNLGQRYTGRFRAVFPRIAREMRTELVAFLLEGVAGEPALNLDDGLHPNAEGHRLVARTVWPVLESVLRAEARERRAAPIASGGGGS